MNPVPADFAGCQQALLAWYRRVARPLPWRIRPSIYATVVSEFMLQQTQVKTVLPYFDRWLRFFPDFAALAAASPSEVLSAWEGLGYYSRARNLHRVAQMIASRGNTGAPTTANEWLALPGIGPYTAAAIASICFGEEIACVDGNVVRILARLRADPTVFRDSASAARALSPTAVALIRGADTPGDFNQAMMELGATVCTRAAPRCVECPVRGICTSGQAGDPGAYPRFVPKTVTRQEVIRVWCVRNDALLLHRHGADAARLAGLHELPTADQAGVTPGALLATKHRTITRFAITESIHAADAPPPATRETAEQGELVWVPFLELPTVALSGPHRRWVNELLT